MIQRDKDLRDAALLFSTFLYQLQQQLQENDRKSESATVLISGSEESECLGPTSYSRYFTQRNQEQALWVIMMSSLR